MHPTVDIYFSTNSCLIIPRPLTPSMRAFAEVQDAEVVSFSEPRSTAGKKLKRVVAIASRSKLSLADANAWIQWPDSYRTFWNSRFMGMIVRKDHRWIIYCGNECSPALLLHLPPTPTDDAAGEAIFALQNELNRLDAE